VLEQARLHAPPELEDRSTIYWFGTYGYTGGHTENAFAGIESALSGAFTPPSSGGGGGGFSGAAVVAAVVAAVAPGRRRIISEFPSGEST